jgi:hypothetical protein
VEQPPTAIVIPTSSIVKAPSAHTLDAMHTKGLLLVAATAMIAIAVADARTVSHSISLLTMLLARNKPKERTTGRQAALH